MIYRAPDYPKAFSWEFYKDRDPVDHWNQPGYHHDRLEHALRLMDSQFTSPPESIADFACGCGGLLAQIKGVKTWGYDISPTAVTFAREVNKLEVGLADITEQGLIPKGILQYRLDYPEWLILTETLEHLVNPMELLVRARLKGVKYVLGSIPSYEAEMCSDLHNWSWTEDSFPKMFELCGYKPLVYDVAHNTQFVIGRSVC